MAQSAAPTDRVARPPHTQLWSATDRMDDATHQRIAGLDIAALALDMACRSISSLDDAPCPVSHLPPGIRGTLAHKRH